MADNIPVMLWIIIAFAVSKVVPNGIAYRQLRAVHFYRRIFKINLSLNEAGQTKSIDYEVKGALRNFIHSYFFSGLLTSTMLALFFVGWTPLWFYKQPTQYYDVIMFLSVLFMGLVLLLPWMFYYMDENYEVRVYVELQRLVGLINQALRNKPPVGEIAFDPKVHSWAKWAMTLFSGLMMVVILIASIFVIVNDRSNRDWVYYVSCVFYWLAWSYSVVIFWFFVDIYFTKKSSGAILPTTSQ